ncbi:MAG TPA: hypothetical protein PKE29_06505 [Phycisphaerales bacterium]|nr:hypothetical protein [Phycisphaerales bacterium]
MPEYDLAAVPAHPDHGPTVVGDLPCTGCGYNLHGIPIARVCPECGRAVELSLQGELLRFSSPAYLKSIDRGLCVILTAIFIYVLIFIVSIGVHFVGSIGQAGITLLTGGLMVLCDLAFIYGYWTFTQPDPGYTGRERPGSARTIARFAACATAAANLAAFLLRVLASVAPSGADFSLAAAGVFSFCAWAAWITLFFAIVLYTQHLARRIPDRALLGQTRTFIWVVPLVFVVGIPLFCAGPVAALILYATMLQSLRTRTKEIIDWQQRAGRAVLGS